MIFQLLNNLPEFVYRKIDKRKLIGGYFHIISDEDKSYIKHLYQYKNTKQFRDDLLYLKKKYHLISYDDFLKNNYTKNSFILTFDDGFRELRTEVLPILEELKIPAIFFITTSIIDNKNWIYRNLVSLIICEIDRNTDAELEAKYLNFSTKENLKKEILGISNDKEKTEHWADVFGIDYRIILLEKQVYLTSKEIVELHKNPLITIGAHSLYHYKYQKMEDDSIKKDIVESCKIIKNITHQNFVPFAFPHSSIGISREVLKKISEENSFIKGFFGEFNYNFADDFVIKRYPLDKPEFPIKKLIKHEAVHHLYKKLKNGN